jgi:hypothetical protein
MVLRSLVAALCRDDKFRVSVGMKNLGALAGDGLEALAG